MINMLLLVLASVLLAVSAYMTPDVPTKLARAGLAVAVLAFLLAGAR